jgi:ferritin-like metal-binding protein YciE
VIAEGRQKEDVAADPELIGAAQKVEHYEIASYGTPRTMAQQIGEWQVAQLLGKSLAEKQNADSILTEVARPLVAQARLAEVVK